MILGATGTGKTTFEGAAAGFYSVLILTCSLLTITALQNYSFVRMVVVILLYRKVFYWS